MNMKNVKKNLFHLILLVLILVTISCTDQKNKNVDYFTCPMHPQIKMENPGQCPICGMTLIPVKKEQNDKNHNHVKGGDNHDMSVKINPRYIQNIGVITEEVKKRDLTQVILTYGKVAHDHKLWVAQNEYIEALSLKDQNLIKATERKLIFLGLSEKWIATIKKTKSADITLHLKTNKSKPKYIEGYVYQEDIGKINEGALVEITDQKSRFLAKGKIKAIGTMVNLNSRSVRVLIESEKLLNLKLNTFVQIRIKIPLGQKLSVMTRSILFNGDHNMVYLVKGKGKYEPKTIEIGEEAGPYHEVISGLKEGDKVVINGHFLIDSESQIKMGTGSGHQHH